MRTRNRVLVGAVVVATATLGMQSAHATVPDYWKVQTYGATVFFGVNDHGDAVGVGGASDLPAIHYAGGGTVLLSDPQRVRGQLESVNSAGVAVGWGKDRTGEIATAFSYDHGTLRELGSNAQAHGINDAGVIAMTLNHQAVLVAPNNTVTHLDQGGLANGVAMDVATGNWATGLISQLDDDGAFQDMRPVLWDPSGQLHLLGLPSGYNEGIGYRVNSSGTVVGFVLSPSLPLTSVVWHAGNPAAQLLPTLGYESASATGLTDAGEIAGVLSSQTSSLGVVWKPDGSVVDVASRMNPAPSDVQFIEDMSNNGTLAGLKVRVAATRRPRCGRRRSACSSTSRCRSFRQCRFRSRRRTRSTSVFRCPHSCRSVANSKS